jgi:hypothetical protein
VSTVRHAGRDIPVLIHPEPYPHPAEEILEEYAFNRLGDAQAAALEEHILICADCQKNLEDIDEYILLMKTATAEYAARPTVIRPALAVKVTWLAAAAFIVLVSVPGLLKALGRWRAEPASTTAPVVLAALRGGDNTTIAQGPAERPLELSMEAADLPDAAYRVEVVNAVGEREWGGAPTASHGTLSVEITKGLKPGTHWVRLFASRGDLVREFGLRLR